MTAVRFNPLAERELWKAAEFYEGERRGLGAEFLEEISRSLAFVVEFPKAAPVIRGSVRRLVVSRFPYSILYRLLQGGGVRVLAIAHHKRRPEFWHGRR